MDTKKSKHKQPKAEEQKPMWQESRKEGGKPRCKKSSTNITKSSHAKLLSGSKNPRCKKSRANIEKSHLPVSKGKVVEPNLAKDRSKNKLPKCRRSNTKSDDSNR